MRLLFLVEYQLIISRLVKLITRLELCLYDVGVFETIVQVPNVLRWSSRQPPLDSNLVYLVECVQGPLEINDLWSKEEKCYGATFINYFHPAFFFNCTARNWKYTKLFCYTILGFWSIHMESKRKIGKLYLQLRVIDKKKLLYCGTAIIVHNSFLSTFF